MDSILIIVVSIAVLIAILIVGYRVLTSVRDSQGGDTGQKESISPSETERAVKKAREVV